MSWFHVVTKDFVNFVDLGEAIPHGSEVEQDLNVFTGCVLQAGGRFHIFYTGHNTVDNGLPNQVIMHATSTDLLSWEKDTGFLLQADPNRYEMDDWRDPFVFWNEKEGEYWVLIAARTRRGPKSRRGCIGLARSRDLANWEVVDPFWSPRLYYTHECPDLFRWGQYWYLVYSTFTERFATHYRVSETLKGPWTAPTNDTFDGRAFYAAKTAAGGTARSRRFAFGWNPTRKGDTDDGSWQWGGNLVVHELLQRADGSLDVILPREITKAFGSRKRAIPGKGIGSYDLRGGEVTLRAPDRFAWLSLGRMPDPSLVGCKVSWGPNTRSCGIMINAYENMDSYYQVRLEPGRDRMVFDRWPRAGDQPFMAERPLDLSRGSSSLTVLTEDTMVEIYADNRVALSIRAYNRRGGFLGVFVSEGEATFSGISVSALK